MAALQGHLDKAGIPHQIVGDPVLFDVFFTDQPVTDYRGVLRNDAKIAKRFNQLLRERGILKPDSKFYISLGLTDDDLAMTVDAIADTARHLLDP